MKKILYTIAFAFLLASCTYEKGEVPELVVAEPPCDSVISYSTHIVPIVNAQCVSCHTTGFTSGDFTSYADLKIKADNGSLKQAVYKNKSMPQGVNTMTEAERHIMKCWVDQGSPNN